MVAKAKKYACTCRGREQLFSIILIYLERWQRQKNYTHHEWLPFTTHVLLEKRDWVSWPGVSRDDGNEGPANSQLCARCPGLPSQIASTPVFCKYFKTNFIRLSSHHRSFLYFFRLMSTLVSTSSSLLSSIITLSHRRQNDLSYIGRLHHLEHYFAGLQWRASLAKGCGVCSAGCWSQQKTSNHQHLVVLYPATAEAAAQKGNYRENYFDATTKMRIYFM